jgi:SAM-dependent methyltransferase
MSNTCSHWDSIFTNQADQELGWFETELAQSKKMIAKAKLSKGDHIFIPGVGTSTIADHLISKKFNLSVNDISSKALEKFRQRTGNSLIEYFHQDIAKPIKLLNKVDLWFDRAVLHFLISDYAITGYFNNIRDNVKSGGYVMLAEFSIGGAQQCAGLPVHPYCESEMGMRLGKDFSLKYSENFIFTNTYHDEKPYIYAVFQRK